jgi:hypothetical protein
LYHCIIAYSATTLHELETSGDRGHASNIPTLRQTCADCVTAYEHDMTSDCNVQLIGSSSRDQHGVELFAEPRPRVILSTHLIGEQTAIFARCRTRHGNLIFNSLVPCCQLLQLAISCKLP